MDFAVYIGEEKILIYKKGDGIILNEPALLAYKNNTLIAVGKSAQVLSGDSGISVFPVVSNGTIRNINDSAVFIRNMAEKVGGITNCIFCISSSLSANELDDMKTAIYSAGIVDAVFIPKVIANAFGCGYNIGQKEDVLSIVTDGNFADMAVIHNHEIVAGGTLEDLSLLDEAKKRLIRKNPAIRQLSGDRISVINGAGRLLSGDNLRKIVKMN